ncbi:MAG: RNA polymerase sigma factor [Armatimonadota bacterium]|nr:MAG: RNA polymerase sigma factor [Armatimonadota bacterium]
MENIRLLGRARAKANERYAEEVGINLAAAYDAYSAALYRYLLALLSDAQDAEDTLQEIFLAVARRGERTRVANLHAYLFRAARNQALLALRRRRRHQKEQAAAALSWIDPEACAPEQREIAIDIARALQQLPPEQREVIALKLSEGLTFREIAKLCGVSLSTAASRYRLALARLRCLLEGGDDHD